jgi:uncharacterized protein (TIGR03067 family)
MRCVLPLLVVVSLGFAPAPVPKLKPIPKSLKAMQGHWAWEDWSMASRPVQVPPLARGRRQKGLNDSVLCLPGATAEVVGTSMVFSRNGKAYVRWQLSSVEPDRAGQGIGHLEIAEAPDGRKMLGIYKLQGDVLTICYRDRAEGRPTEFTNAGQWMLVLSRKKP